MYNVEKGDFMRKILSSKKALIIITVIAVVVISFFAYFEAIKSTPHKRAYASEQIEAMEIEYVNINTADVEELCSIKALSEKQAQGIVDHREKFGEFKSIEEIKNVKSIGDKTYESIKLLIKI